VSDSPKALLMRHHLRPKKEWGQNFLGDANLLARIAAVCGAGAADTVVELGAGLGHFTRALAATGARVVAVERDRELVAVLELESFPPNVRILAANAAELDFAQAAGVPRAIVAGNLPYQLTSSILFSVLEQRQAVRRAVFLVQEEVAERLAAEPGGREYGLLSVLLQAYADVEVAMRVKASVFHPPPKVDSAVVRIEMLERPRAEVRDAARFVRLVKAAFGLRRKTLLNALKAAKDLGEPAAIASALEKAGIDPVRRAETLSPQEFAALERAFGEPPPPLPPD
jgi:16S rRNA (adenine1518-N6/adenine1519-N6)-dimethyltransferase